MIKIVYVLLAMLIVLPITTFGYYNRKNLPGALLCLALATAAWYLGRKFPLIGGAIIAILLGMLLANVWSCPQVFKVGISATSKRVLQSAIVLFGFQLNLSYVLNLGGQGLVLICVTIVTSLLLAYAIGKALRMQTNEQILLGVGTAICGGSAIAAVAPIIKADEREVVTALSIIFLLNNVPVFIFPLVGHILSMSDLRFGMWCGAAINDTSHVVAAAFSYSDAAGENATIVKLTRTLMIIPITFALAILQAKKADTAGGFQIGKVFPWFVAAFFAACVINSLHLVPAQVSAFWGNMGRFCIMIAMAAIGLSTNLRELIRHGKKPVFLGCCLTFAVALISFLAQIILEMT
jgi:uncharacterized integral membrane protein (TIGR00698 family)